MDNLRGQFPDRDDAFDDAQDADFNDDEIGDDLPPAAIGQDERRMQVRAYNFWAGLLGDHKFPAVEDLDPDGQGDFGPYSVLLDFTSGIENPAIVFLGDKLGEECGAESSIECLNDVPSRSLLSRITDHYLQIIANQAPIGFEAEFVNQRGTTILYRGILLPFSSDDDTIDFIYGVINWKELADQQTADELLLEINQVLEPSFEREDEPLPMADWADGPVGEPSVLDLGPEQEASGMPEAGESMPLPSLSTGANRKDDRKTASPTLTAAPDPGMALADWLATARDLADEAKASETRSRQALYAAISHAYDFSCAAEREPDAFRQIVEDAGLTIQERTPMTPVVKLVFGIDYDKTRLAEFAAALDHAHRLGLGSGEMEKHLAATAGGLKALVAEERRLRRIESGKPESPAQRLAMRNGLARKLRKLESCSLTDVPSEGSEFTLLVARRTSDGEVVLLGEVSQDIALIEKAAKQLLG